MLFLGTYPYSMDERGRVPIPPRFRDAFLAGLILTQGTPDNCVRVYPRAVYEKIAEEYLAGAETSREPRVRARIFFSSAYPTEMDRQSRILIPAQLRSWADLGNEVVVAGAGSRLEVWNAATFAEVMAQEQAEMVERDRRS